MTSIHIAQPAYKINPPPGHPRQDHWGGECPPGLKRPNTTLMPRPSWDDRWARRAPAHRRERNTELLSIESARAAWLHLNGLHLVDTEGFVTEALKSRSVKP